jgi:4-amino-4-deoxy-L-arabinose transferase-like glycosyltransferase
MQSEHLRRWAVCYAALFAAVALVRIVATYKSTAQGFDEPCHVAAGVELIDKGKYRLDTVHPPLSRWAIGLPVYIAGERYPKTGVGATSNDYNVVGNSILYESGHHQRDLTLARIGVLPFFLFAVCVVYFWARREFGSLSAVMAVVLFTTLPTVLAFSGIAYTDMVAASTQAAAFFSFARWLEKKTVRSGIVLGAALGLALSAKFTSLIFIPAGGIAICIIKWAFGRRSNRDKKISFAQLARQVAIIALLTLGVLWSGYKFRLGHVREDMQLSTASMPTFQNLPAPLRTLAQSLVLSDPAIPAPALFKGLATIWVLNHRAPNSYLLGHIKHGGWWYFFLVAIGVKSPLPFLVLAGIGVFASWRRRHDGQWTAFAPAACLIAILLATMPVKYDAGVRHVLVVFPLLAILAGHGCSYLWQSRAKGTVAVRVAMLVLLAWQAASTWHAHSDYIAYFNELAGDDPSRVLVLGCDLDCGQDLGKLADELRTRQISRVTLALWTSADINGADLPQFAVAEPFVPASGWFAISLRALRFGDSFHQSFPPEAFAWLNQYKPAVRIGKTILLYYIPDKVQTAPSAGMTKGPN